MFPGSIRSLEYTQYNNLKGYILHNYYYLDMLSSWYSLIKILADKIDTESHFLSKLDNYHHIWSRLNRPSNNRLHMYRKYLQLSKNYILLYIKLLLDYLSLLSPILRMKVLHIVHCLSHSHLHIHYISWHRKLNNLKYKRSIRIRQKNIL